MTPPLLPHTTARQNMHAMNKSFSSHTVLCTPVHVRGWAQFKAARRKASAAVRRVEMDKICLSRSIQFLYNAAPDLWRGPLMADNFGLSFCCLQSGSQLQSPFFVVYDSPRSRGFVCRAGFPFQLLLTGRNGHVEPA